MPKNKQVSYSRGKYNKEAKEKIKSLRLPRMKGSDIEEAQKLSQRLKEFRKEIKETFGKSSARSRTLEGLGQLIDGYEKSVKNNQLRLEKEELQSRIEDINEELLDSEPELSDESLFQSINLDDIQSLEFIWKDE